jgi:hypothetical protein
VRAGSIFRSLKISDSLGRLLVNIRYERLPQLSRVKQCNSDGWPMIQFPTSRKKIGKSKRGICMSVSSYFRNVVASYKTEARRSSRSRNTVNDRIERGALMLPPDFSRYLGVATGALDGVVHTYISCTVSTAACEICTVRWLNTRDLLESESSTFWRRLYFLAADRGLKYVHSLNCYKNPTCNAWLRISTVKRCTLRFALATKRPQVVLTFPMSYSRV